mmetsp:Transcript_3949/g.16456  ORF Transcript_3949/g.16456 Transcript_3949/m.16456 type:complete len:442 (-) Transcript_3949:570-1895(-)
MLPFSPKGRRSLSWHGRSWSRGRRGTAARTSPCTATPQRRRTSARRWSAASWRWRRQGRRASGSATAARLAAMLCRTLCATWLPWRCRRRRRAAPSRGRQLSPHRKHPLRRGRRLRSGPRRRSSPPCRLRHRGKSQTPSLSVPLRHPRHRQRRRRRRRPPPGARRPLLRQAVASLCRAAGTTRTCLMARTSRCGAAGMTRSRAAGATPAAAPPPAPPSVPAQQASPPGRLRSAFALSRRPRRPLHPQQQQQRRRQQQRAPSRPGQATLPRACPPNCGERPGTTPGQRRLAPPLLRERRGSRTRGQRFPSGRLCRRGQRLEPQPLPSVAALTGGGRSRPARAWARLCVSASRHRQTSPTEGPPKRSDPHGGWHLHGPQESHRRPRPCAAKGGSLGQEGRQRGPAEWPCRPVPGTGLGTEAPQPRAHDQQSASLPSALAPEAR